MKGHVEPLTFFRAFEQWLAEYSRASEMNDPQASAELFSENALYYESPFNDPLVGRAAIYEYWSRGAQALRDKVSSFEILAARDNLGIANWRSEFVVVSSGKRLALDCLFVVEFDPVGKCRVFREWWHSQEITTISLQDS